MLLACIIAVLSVLFGALLGFWRRTTPEHLGPIKTFAFAAAVAVVVTSFLPEAMSSLGAIALAPLAAGFLGPRLLELAFTRFGKHDHGKSVGLEVGYAGLALHQIGDGIGMGSLVGPSHDGHQHLDVFLAIGGHTIPVAAVVVLAFVRAKGRRVAAIRALGLALFVVAGVLIARLTGVSITSTWGGLTSAVVGGLLLHIATHDLAGALPKTHIARAVDLAAAAAGVMVVAAGEHEPGEASLDLAAVATAARAIASASAPGLLAGLAIALGLALWRRRDAEAGAPSIPLRDVDAGVVAGALSIALLDLRIAVPYFAVWLAMAWGATRSDDHHHDEAPAAADEPRPTVRETVVGSLASVSLAAWPWWLLGVGGAAYVAVGLRASPGFTLSAASVVALVASGAFAPPFAVVLAMALGILGAPSEAIVAGLMAGIAAWRLRKHRGKRRIVASLVLPVLLGGASLVWIAFAAGAQFDTRGIGGTVSLFVALAIGLALLYAEGTRGVAHTMLSATGAPECDHDHGHAHDPLHHHVETLDPRSNPLAS